MSLRNNDRQAVHIPNPRRHDSFQKKDTYNTAKIVQAVGFPGVGSSLTQAHGSSASRKPDPWHEGLDTLSRPTRRIADGDCKRDNETLKLKAKLNIKSISSYMQVPSLLTKRASTFAELAHNAMPHETSSASSNKTSNINTNVTLRAALIKRRNREERKWIC